MTSSGRVIKTEKMGWTRAMAESGAWVGSVVVAAVAAHGQHQSGHRGTEGGGEQRRLDRLLRHIAAGRLRVFADIACALAGQVLDAIAQVADLLAGPAHGLTGQFAGGFERLAGEALGLLAIAGGTGADRSGNGVCHVVVFSW